MRNNLEEFKYGKTSINYYGAHCSVAYGIGSNCECMLHKHMKKGTQLELEGGGQEIPWAYM